MHSCLCKKLIVLFVIEKIKFHLECGIRSGEPIDGGGIVGVGNSVVETAAVSG